MEETTRQRIADRLRAGPATPSELATEFDVTAAAAVRHARHLARSLEPTDDQLRVAPPACEDCGFDRFDDPANRPSRCPDCKSEAVTEPVFKIA